MTGSSLYGHGWRRMLALLVLVALVALGAAAASGSAAPSGSTNLKITKTDNPDPVRVGSPLTYTIRVEDLGPISATGVTVVDSLPRGVTVSSATASTGQCGQQGGKVTCTLGTVFFGVNYGPAPTVTLVVIPQQPGRITNTATVKADQKDPIASNNTANATTRVLAARKPPKAYCRGVRASIVGVGGDDVLTGTGGPDVIVARGGGDAIFSRAGRDLVCAGRGADHVGAGSAADRVFGSAGRDRLIGRGGPDLLSGGSGNDVLKGNRGSDRLRGGRGFDICKGGPGRDSYRGCEVIR